MLERRQFIATASLATLTVACGQPGQPTQTPTAQADNQPTSQYTSAPAPRIQSLGQGLQLWGPGGDTYEFMVTGGQSGGSTFVLHANVPPGGGPPPHIHTRESESYYIETGELLFTLGEQSRTVRAGDFVHIPKGTVHTFTNRGQELASMVVTFVPAGMEGWFEEVLVPVKPTDTKPVDYTPEQLAFMIEAGPRHGVEWRLPAKV